jgi:hypothetical protein
VTKRGTKDDSSRVSVKCAACGHIYSIRMGAGTDTIRDVSCPSCHQRLAERRKKPR